ncbi:MAG: hypothetical protein V1725_06930 [archaeon]
MEIILTVIAIAFLLLAVLIVIKFIKHLLTAALLILALAALCIFAMGTLVYLDVKDLQEKGAQGSVLLLLADDDQIKTGFITGNPLLPLSEQQLAQLQQQYALDNYEQMRAANYLLVIIDLQAIKDSPVQNVTIFKTTLRKTDLITVMTAQDSILALAQVFEQPRQLMEQFLISQNITAASLRSQAFAIGTASLVQNATNVLREYKQGNIRIYPKTLVFSVIKFIPLAWIERSMPTIAVNATKPD